MKEASRIDFGLERKKASTPILEVCDLHKSFSVRSGFWGSSTAQVQALTAVNFEIGRGEVVGLVGESGSGKSTLARCLVGLQKPTGGEIYFNGVDLARLNSREFRPFRRELQMIFQDPFSSLNPRLTVGSIVGEPLRIHKLASGSKVVEKVSELLRCVGLPDDAINRTPHEFSGGQRQRIGIARALAVNPSFVVADEPVSALDVSIQAQVLKLIQDLRQQFSLTMLFISHDLPVVEYLCDRVIVLYLGRIMEIAPRSRIYSRPRHPYTEALLAAAPLPNPFLHREERAERQLLKGDLPSPLDPPSGCVFRTRCAYAILDCASIVPELKQIELGCYTACIRDIL